MSSTQSLRPHDLVVLQRSAGNQAVSRLLQMDVTPEAHVTTTGDLAAAETPTPAPRMERLLDRVRGVARWSLRWPVD
jgi:hypothetical protein